MCRVEQNKYCQKPLSGLEKTAWVWDCFFEREVPAIGEITLVLYENIKVPKKYGDISSYLLTTLEVSNRKTTVLFLIRSDTHGET